MAVVDGQTDLLIIRLEHPCAGFVDHTHDAVALGRRAPETWFKPACLIEPGLDGKISRPVDEANLAVERHARQAAVIQPTDVLELRLDQPAPVGTRQTPQLVPLNPTD
jgi:hypothetical protein